MYGVLAIVTDCFEFQTQMRVKILTSETGEEFIDNEEVAFVVNEFEGPIFERFCTASRTLFGPTAIKELAQSKVC